MRIFGVMRMRDEKGIDDKLIAVSSRDPAVADHHSLNDIPAHTLRELKRFFVDYKVLEHKEVLVAAPLGRMEALRTLYEAFALYKKEFGRPCRGTPAARKARPRAR